MLSKVGWAYYASAGDDEISKYPFVCEYELIRSKEPERRSISENPFPT